MKIVKNYRNNKELRDSFNKLAEVTFGLNFETWYQNGYWGDNYNPYSIVVDGEVVSNVSVNRTDMLINGEVKHFIQLGTVMTYEKYRNQGYIRAIMKEIMNDYETVVDGMYLFANDNVCEFYPKFGFVKGKEFKHSITVHNSNQSVLKKHIMDSREDWEQFERVMNNNIFHGKMDMIANNELIMFYVTQFMKEDVYYHKESDTYIVVEIEEEKAVIHNVFSTTIESLELVCKLLGKDISCISLGFTPLNAENYQKEELIEDDCTFFVRGEKMNIFEADELRIPSLAHA